MAALKTFGDTVHDLPPLILHPFNERVPPSELVENSKAALMLAGLIPGDGSDAAEMESRVLAGRYSEIRMLFFLGKDVFRWLEQCLESVGRTPGLSKAGLRAQSFAALLSASPPDAVREKLARWGVADYASIFSRAIGLHAMFLNPPEFGLLAVEFLRNYHRYADALYRCFMQTEHPPVTGRNFRFELYASAEYSRMLESEWGTG